MHACRDQIDRDREQDLKPIIIKKEKKRRREREDKSHSFRWNKENSYLSCDDFLRRGTLGVGGGARVKGVRTKIR